MIKNLNKTDFSPYGGVLGGRTVRHGFPAGELWTSSLVHIAEDENILRVCPEADVFMDYEKGMAILMVAPSADTDKLEAFYLDKPVCVKRGVYFCVLPFDESCDVHFCARADARLETVPLERREKAVVISSNMSVKCIRTLFYQQKEEGFFFRGEAHRQYELTYMDKGSMHSIVGGQDYMMRAGEMMLYGPLQWHAQFAEPDERVCFLTITFDMDCKYADILFNKKLAVEPGGAALLNRILEQSRQADVLSSDMICCYLMQFLLNMISTAYHGDGASKLSYPYAAKNENAIVDKALRHISAHIYERLTVAGVARAVNVCASYLTVLFSKHLQINPGDYIRRERLEESKRLIRQGDMNFTQVADKLKFSSVYHFSNQFKRWYGMTPSEFSRTINPGELSGEGRTPGVES